jgi:two-component system OmpR family sensor kinase
MQFDDRLATVLRSGTGSEQSAHAQFRQLLDLLGSSSDNRNGPLVQQAYARLADFEQTLPATERARIIREPGLRLRDRGLLSHLAEGDPQPAAAALATARLDEEQWLTLIPELTVTARGFLRHRRDLPENVAVLLARLGVQDLVLPKPEYRAAQPTETEFSSVGASVSTVARRIEAFRQARQRVHDQSTPGGRAGGVASTKGKEIASSCDVSIDAEGEVKWAEAGFAAWLVGVALRTQERVDATTLIALLQHQPVKGGRVILDGVASIAGEWRLDATPHFTRSGSYAGHFGRLRRPVLARRPSDRQNGQGDRVRQALHEMRTPLGGIQGFAEIIQHQMFGPVPNAYRALAGAIAVDTARVLAGFEELERLAKLQREGLEPPGEPISLKSVVERTLRRLEGVLRPVGANIRLLVSGDNFGVGLTEDDAALLVWRVLAAVAGALAPGEVIELALRSNGRRVALAAELPLALAQFETPFAAMPPARQTIVSAGMFGTGFTLRLARAEAEAAGGSFLADEELLMIELPLLD